MRNVMTKAWEIAREGAKKFGGKVSEYFAEALRIAWSIVKKGMEKVKLIGTEKQVAWAEDLRHAVKVAYEIGKKAAFETANEKRTEKLKVALKYIEEVVLTQEKAEYYIDHFRQFNVRKLRDVLAKEVDEKDKDVKLITIKRILQWIDFTQFTEDLKAKGYKFASMLRVIEAMLEDIEIIEKYEDELKKI